MERKIKLTDLSHLELLNEELSHLKGGDDPDTKPSDYCSGCNCACTCINPTPAGNTTNSTYSSNRHGGLISRITEVPPLTKWD